MVIGRYGRGDTNSAEDSDHLNQSQRDESVLESTLLHSYITGPTTSCPRVFLLVLFYFS
jgi:hypothetical protein